MGATMGKSKQTKRRPSDAAQAIRIQVLQRAKERLHRGGYVDIFFAIFYCLACGACLGAAYTATSNIGSMFFTLLSALSLGLVVFMFFHFIQRHKDIDGFDYTIRRISKDIYGEEMWNHKPKKR